MYDRFIRFHARARPQAPAFVTLKGEISYKAFDETIDKIAAALDESDVRGARLVGLCVTNSYNHCTFLMALARLGITSTSIGPSQLDQMGQLLAPELLITDLPATHPVYEGALRTLCASAQWFERAQRRADGPVAGVAPDPNSFAVVTTSSGTTGTPKPFGMSWRMLEANASAQSVFSLLINPGVPLFSRALTTLGLDAAGFLLVLATWVSGGAVILAGPGPLEIAAALQQLSPSVMVLAPIQLGGLLKVLPPGFLPSPDLALFLVGSDTPLAIRQEARLRLTCNVWISYGSREVGLVAIAHAGQLAADGSGTGWVIPAAEVEIVDDDGVLVPRGEPGVIRMRKLTALADHYIGAEADTTESFRDGWFYPGDVGTLADGLLTVMGRTNEVMNFGGQKFLPEAIERPVLGCAGVEDAAAFALPDAAGVPKPWLAVVRGEGIDTAEISRALAIPLMPPVHVVWIDEIPRNGMGKIDRRKLAAAAASLASQS